MKCIFLDIDGVLNSMDFLYVKKDILNGGSTSSRSAVDPVAVKLLDRLVQDSGAEVVLSSTWRINHTMKEMNKILRDKGFSKKLLDFTPRIYWDESLGLGPRSENERGNEIDHWLKNHSNVTHFVIFDDDADMNPHKDKLVQTNWQHGLLPEHIEKARIILGV